MKNIYIINDLPRPSGLYGVGAFVKELAASFDMSGEYIVNMLEIDTNAQEFKIEKFGNRYILQVPANYNWYGDRRYYKSVLYLLNLYHKIPKDAYFIFNHNEHSELAHEIKRQYDLPKIVFVIHYFSWMWAVKADIKTFIKYIRHLSNSQVASVVRTAFEREQKMMKISDRIVTLSDDSEKLIHKAYEIDRKKITTINNGISDLYKPAIISSNNYTRKQLYLNLDEKIILYVGRLDVMKGLDVLISSFRDVASKYNNCRLVVIGDGDLSSVISKAGDAATRITFTGRIFKEQVLKWYNIADIGVLPSLSEECSFVGIEMMMYGLPIIATNGRGVRDMFRNNDNALTVNCLDSRRTFETQLTKAMFTLLNNSVLATQLGQNARKCYLERYHVDIMKQRYKELIENLATW